MPKSAPFSMRLSAGFDAVVTDEARRTKRSKGAIVEALAEEAMHMRLFPGIAFKGTDWDRRPWVIGTGFDVWQVIDAYNNFDSAERMADSFSLDAHHITCDVKDFPGIARRWAEATRQHAGCAMLVGIDHSEFGAILRVIERELQARPRQDDWRNYNCFVSRGSAQ